jgi:antirestriction protein ArdC
VSRDDHAEPKTGRRADDARRAAAREQMRAGIEALRSSDGWRRWAEVRARFHRYSRHNSFLILAQRPDATQVAGYRRWQELGRQVRHGERAIRIWAPRVVRERDAETGERKKSVVGFMAVPVFDVSQTDGAPLPKAPAPEPLTGDSHADRVDGLRAAATSLGIDISIEPIDGPMEGYYSPRLKRIVVDSAQAPNAIVATLVHELAHAHGVSYERYGRAAAEVIAETAAYVALRAIGLQADAACIPYVAAWAEDSAEALERHAQTVDEVAEQLEAALGLQNTLARKPDERMPDREPLGESETWAADRRQAVDDTQPAALACEPREHYAYGFELD